MKIEDTKAWLDERLSISTLTHLADKKEVPLHRHSIWYYFGGMTMFLFCVQVVTGILLLLYYRPSAENAFESVQFIITEVKFGWLIRCGRLDSCAGADTYIFTRRGGQSDWARA